MSLKSEIDKIITESDYQRRHTCAECDELLSRLRLEHHASVCDANASIQKLETQISKINKDYECQLERLGVEIELLFREVEVQFI